eukprot:8820382-Lingulodinium_polyedra.AAC.1
MGIEPSRLCQEAERLLLVPRRVLAGQVELRRGQARVKPADLMPASVDGHLLDVRRAQGDQPL